MSLSFNMKIGGRKVKAVYLKDTNLFYVELLLGKGDCPEKRVNENLKRMKERNT